MNPLPTPLEPTLPVSLGRKARSLYMYNGNCACVYTNSKSILEYIVQQTAKLIFYIAINVPTCTLQTS